MNNISVPQFFKDFTGSITDFRLLIDNLSRGTADPDKYGSPDEQLKLLEELHKSFVGIHPTNANNSVQPDDLGEWFYYNHRYYRTGGGSGGCSQGAQGAQGVQGAQGISGTTATKDIIAVGVNIGGYNSGDVIEPGTDFETIFRTLLTRIVDVVKTEPNPRAVNNGFPNGIVEVGTIQSFTLGINWVDGYFSSADTEAYTNEQFNENNQTTNGRLNAGCVQGAVTYTGTPGTGLQGNQVQGLVIGPMNYTYKVTVPWGESTAVPKMSNNEPSAVKINAGSKDIQSSFAGKYKYFYGYVEGRNVNDYTGVIASQADLNDPTKIIMAYKGDSWLNNNGVAAQLASMDSHNKGSYTAHAIILPDGFHITAAKTSTGNDLGPEAIAAWELRDSFDYIPTGGQSPTVYHVYIRHVLQSSGGIEYKQIRIERKK